MWCQRCSDIQYYETNTMGAKNVEEAFIAIAKKCMLIEKEDDDIVILDQRDIPNISTNKSCYC